MLLKSLFWNLIKFTKIQKLSEISNIINIDTTSVLLPNTQKTNNLISNKLKLPKIKEKILIIRQIISVDIVGKEFSYSGFLKSSIK